MMRLVLLASLALLPFAGARCSCCCSAQVVPIFTRGGRIHCSPVCTHYTSDIIQEEIARKARMAAVQQAAECTKVSLKNDAAWEKTVRAASQEDLHAGGSNTISFGVPQFEQDTDDRCRAQVAVNKLAEMTDETEMEAAVGLSKLKVPSNTSPPTIPQCNTKERYPSYDGTCNNLRNPRQGAVGTPYVRYSCPIYGNGVNSVRRATDGSELPSARLLRELLIKYTTQRTQSDSLSLLTVPFMQLIAHNTALSSFLRGKRGQSILCCAEDTTTSSKRSPLHREPSSCSSIKGPDNNCMSVVRGVAMYNDGACFGNVTYVGPGEKVNSQSSYLHLVPVYGNNEDAANALRGEEGKLREDERACFPPVDPESGCAPRPGSSICFETGDIRANQNPPLTMLQVLFFCCHNKIAKELKRINPHWSDDRVYNESRMINMATYQNIIYNEAMTVMFGRENAEKHHLIPRPGCDEEEYCYDPSVDATTSNEYTAACFRILHTIIPGILRMRNDEPSDECPQADLHLSDVLHDSDAIVQPKCRFRQMENALVHQPSEALGAHGTIEISEWMFRTNNTMDPGQDLFAFDIERGRDHGLPPYCSYLFFADGHCCNTWRDLERHINPKHVKKLSEIYKDPNDVDLYLAALLEETEGYSMMGHTCMKILIEEFTRKKHGDRFFYTNGQFTKEQLCEIKKVTMARLMCDCGKNIKEMQPHAFYLPSTWNCRVKCDQIPKMNLAAWKEQKKF